MPLRSEDGRIDSNPPPPRPGLRRAIRYAALVAVLGLVLTGALTWWRVSVDRRADANVVAGRGELLVFETRGLFEEAAMQLTATASLFRASDYVSVEEFRLFVDDLGPMPGMLGLGYVPAVADDDLAGWLIHARKEIPDFEVFELDDDGVPSPLQDRELRFPLFYFEPDGGGVAVPGFDLGSEAQLLEEALGTLAVEPIALVTFLTEDTAPIPSSELLLMAKGIREPGHDSVSEFVIGVVDINDLINENAAAEVTRGLQWSVEDVTDGTDSVATPDPAWNGFVEYGGRTLRFTVAAQSGASWRGGLAGIVLVSGIAISLLLGTVVFLVLRRLEARAEMAVLESINTSKDEFLAAVSHRLRTPLTAVVGFSEVLRESDQELSDSDRRELVSTIAVQAIELGHLFDNLLTVTRGTGRSRFISSRVSLAREVYTVLDTADPDRRVKVRVTTADRGVTAAGDPALIRQILRNLIANATDFGDRVEISVTATEPAARVVVRDNGPGVAKNEEGEVFALYGSRGKEGQPESMGVGLFVSRRLARRMSGDLTYRREDGWTVFELTLPAVPVAIDTGPTTAPASSRN